MTLFVVSRRFCSPLDLSGAGFLTGDRGFYLQWCRILDSESRVTGFNLSCARCVPKLILGGFGWSDNLASIRSLLAFLSRLIRVQGLDSIPVVRNARPRLTQTAGIGATLINVCYEIKQRTKIQIRLKEKYSRPEIVTSSRLQQSNCPTITVTITHDSHLTINGTSH